MDLTPLEPWIAAKVGASPLTRDKLEHYQLTRLQETIAWVRSHSRFYNRHLANAPPHLESLADLARFPFTAPAHISDDPLSFVCVSLGEIERVVTLHTSGSTGAPKRLYFTQADQALTVDFFHTGMSTFTVPDNRVLVLLPCAQPGSVGDLLAQALERLGAESIRHGPVTDVRSALSVMETKNVTGLVGTPTQVLALARHPEQHGHLVLEFALLTADHVPQAVVSAVEAALGCTVYNHYGMTEMGLGGGVECRARRGYHLREADLYFEIVDTDTGLPVPEGEQGEIVFTTLTRRGMPLLRYRTGDTGHFLPGACPCGTVLRTLAPIRHRSENIVSLSSGEPLTLADLDEALLGVSGVVDYAASFAAGPPDVLEVTLATHRGQVSANEALAALRRLPVVTRAETKGSLKLEVSVAPEHVPSPAKRTFNDGRVRMQPWGSGGANLKPVGSSARWRRGGSADRRHSCCDQWPDLVRGTL